MFHLGQWRMALYFAFDGSLNERIKQIGGAQFKQKPLTELIYCDVALKSS